MLLLKRRSGLRSWKTLIDYFIIAPARDKALREEFDKKIEKAGRKKLSLPPLTES